jgi:formylglycine-generating enzyme required for sulfatase activity
MNDRQRRRSPGTWARIALGMLVLAAGCKSDQATNPPPTAPVCGISPTTLDFGSVTVGQTRDASVTIRNDGAGDLSGTVSLSDPEYSIVYGAGDFSLGAGFVHQVTVRFAPTSTGTKSCVLALGTGRCSGVECTGLGKEPEPACSLWNAPLNFSEVPLGMSKTGFFLITNDGGGVLSGTISASGPDFTILEGGGAFALSFGQFRQVTVRFAPVSTGRKDFVIDLGSTSCGSAPATGIGVAAATMVLIPAGTFTMGSPEDELGRDSDENQHRVTLSSAILVGTWEVRQCEWQTVMGYGGSGSALHPVTDFTWFDALEFCNRRSTLDGLTPPYTLTDVDNAGSHIVSATASWNRDANGYRLPTEAEWEYACRALSPTAFSDGGITVPDCEGVDPNLDAVGWYCANSTGPEECGLKAPNAWGLHDMHGNVWEWCWDWYGAYADGAVTDPTGPRLGLNHVVRGGYYGAPARRCRSACRAGQGPTLGSLWVGLRLVRNAGGPSEPVILPPRPRLAPGAPPCRTRTRPAGSSATCGPRRPE